MINILKAFHLSIALFATVILAACGGLTQSDKPADSTWWLKPYETQVPSTGAVTPLSVEVAVIPGLDTNQILTLSADAELNHYTAASWADNLPEMVGSLVNRSLQSSGRFDVVSRHAGGGSEECSLMLEVEEFFVVTGSNVHVAVSGRYICDTGQSTPIRSQVLVPVHENHISTIVAAFQRATDSVMKDLLQALP